MATPARKLILDNLKTVLEAITVGGGYKSTVARVEPLVRDAADVDKALRPYLCFIAGRTRYAHLPGGNVRAVMTVHIVGHVAGSSDSDAAAKLSNLEDDVWKALNTDTTRGGNAVMTTITESETDEGDPDKQSTVGAGTFELTAEIVYNRTTGGT